MSAPMVQILEGFHVEFQPQVTKLKVKGLRDSLWRLVAEDKVI